MATSGSAPTYTVPTREIVAVEHPMVVKNIDNGLKTFGKLPFTQIIQDDDHESCLPLYLRIRDPTCAPILSHNTPTSNVLLKITLPKRTGRKRKRGSQDPFVAAPDHKPEMESVMCLDNGQSTSLRSHSRLDSPRDLLRSMKDNEGHYMIEAVGSVEQTHRFRGLADFHYSTTHGAFMTKFRETILTGDLESVKKFKLDPSRGVKQNVELIPPPSLTDHPLPFNWGYHQNSAIRIKTDEKTGEKILVNQSAPEKVNTLYISHNVKTVPQAAPKAPPQEPVLRSLVAELLKALDERPIWTRRAILNHIGSVPGLYLLKPAIQYVGYQFRGGPWRDAVIKYGIDPRTDPKYRFYQTLFFKIFDETEKVPGQPWHDIRSEYTRKAHQDASSRVSHIFDGKTISLDGKIWQICDVNDPLVKRIVATDAVRVTCDIDSDGWWCNGTFAKIKAVMRAKISAIRIGRELTEEEFEPTLAFPDVIKDKKKPSAPMPDWRHDLADLEGSGMATALKMGSIRKRRVKGKAHRSTKGGTTGIPIWRKQSKKSGMKATSVSTTDPSFDGVMGVLGENGTPERPDETRNKSTHGIFGLDEDDDDEREIYDLVIEDEEGMESDSVDDPFETADEGEYGDYTMMEDEV